MTDKEAKELTAAEAALCANSFFRHRHDSRPRFKRPTKKYNHKQTVKIYGECVMMARYYAKIARAKGFRGSFIDAALAIEKIRENRSL